MARIELNIVALGDFKSVNSQIKALQDQVNLLNKSVATVGINANLTKQLNEANAAFKSTVLSTGQFTASTVRLKAETDKFGDALVGGKLKLTEYFRIIKAGSTNATAQMRALAIEQTKLQNSMVMSDPTKQGVLSVYTPTRINAIANATKIAANTQNLYNIAVDKGAQSLINWGKNTQWAGRQLTVGMTVPLTIFGATAMNVFKEVNEQMIRMQKVYGNGIQQPSQQALSAIRDQILSLSKELASSMGTAVKDTAAMAADLAATGLQGVDLVNATREAIRLQKLGEMDQQDAMQTTISLQNVYKLSTNQLSGAIDFLNAVENQTSTSMQDLAAGIPKVGPIVQQLGGSFKDTALMMVAMKEAGVPAAQSANAIKSALASLINPTTAAKDAFAAYNINLSSIATKTGGNPVQMIMMLQESLKGLQPLAQAQLIDKLFGKYQQARIQALITNLGSVNSQTKQAFDLMNSSEEQLKGIAAGELKTATESTTGKFRRAVETMKADLLPVGEKIMQVATALLNFGNSVAKVFGGLPSPVKTVLGILAAGIALSGPIIMFTGVLANFVGYLVKGLFSMKNLINGTKTFGQLFTPEIIASQNAAQLFSQKILQDESAVMLLNQAVKQLTISLQGMAMGMAAASGTGLAGKVLAAEAGLAGGRIPFRAPKKLSGGYVPGNSADGDVFPALLQGGEAVIPTKQAEKYAPFINAMIKGTLPQHGDGVTPGGSSRPTAAFSQAEKVYSSMLGVKETQMGIIAKEIAAMRAAGMSITSKSEKEMMFGNISHAAPRQGEETKDWSDYSKMYALTAPENQSLNLLTRPNSKNNVAAFGQSMENAISTMVDEGFNETELRASAKGILAGKQPIEKLEMKLFKVALDDIDKRVTSGELKPGKNFGSRTLPWVKSASAITGARLAGELPTAEQMRLDLNPNATAEKAYHAAEKRLAKAINVESKAASASKETKKAAKNLVDGVTETLKESKTKVKAASQSMMEESLLSGSGGEYTNLASETEPGLATTSRSGGRFAKFNEKRMAARAKLQSRMPKIMTGRFSSLGMGLGLQLAGQFAAPMINKLPGGNVINGAITGASYGAFLGPEGALAGAAIGASISGISKLIATEKEHQAAVKASFTASADVINMFGGTIVDQTPKIHSFAKQIKLSAESASELEKNVNAISKMDAKTSSLRQVSDLLKGQNTASSVIGTAKQFAASQVANGMDPSKVSQMISAMLTYAGKTQYLKQALKEITAETKDAETATTTWLNKLLNAAGDVSQMSSSYDRLNVSQKAFVDGTYQVINQILNTNTSFEKAISLANGLTTALGNSANAYKALIIAATNNGDTELATLLAKYQASNIDLNEAALAAKVQERTPLPKGKSESWLKTKEGLDWLRNTAKQQAIEDNNALKIANKKHDILVKDVLTNQKILDNLKNTLAAAEKRLKVEQDTANALKEQQEYQLTQTNLDSQIRIAKGSGDYLKANILMQEKAFNEFNFVNGKKQNPLQTEIDTLKEKISIAEAKLNTTTAKLTPVVPTLPLGPTAKTDSEMTTYLKNIDLNILAMRKIAEQKGITGTGSSAAPFTVDNSPGFNTTNIKKSLDADGRIKKAVPIVGGGLSPQERSFIELLKASIPGLHGENGGKKGSGSYVVYNGHKYYMRKLDQPGYLDSIIEIGSYVPGLAAGGPITGKGTATSDSIPAYLSNGEYVIKASSVNKYGKGMFDSLNAGHFANGGEVTKNGWLQKWANSITGSPAAEMFGTASILRKLAGLGKPGDNLATALFPLNFMGMGGGKSLFLGMPRGVKALEEARKAEKIMQEIHAAIQASNFKSLPITKLGEQLESTVGKSFPVNGIGGLYKGANGTKEFVKPVTDALSGLSEIRSNQIARDVQGLDTPIQELIKIMDPSDPKGKRTLLALRSAFNPEFANPTGKFTKDQYFRQLVSSLLRGDKDLQIANLSGNNLVDAGTSGVFNLASGIRTLSKSMPSMQEQATINLLGVKGGAKRFFAESTASIAKSMTPKEYHDAIVAEIKREIPLLEKTIASFKLTDPDEIEAYANMLERLKAGAKPGVDWSSFQKMAASVVPAPTKKPTAAALAKKAEELALKKKQSGHAVGFSDIMFKDQLGGYANGGMVSPVGLSGKENAKPSFSSKLKKLAVAFPGIVGLSIVEGIGGPKARGAKIAASGAAKIAESGASKFSKYFLHAGSDGDITGIDTIMSTMTPKGRDRVISGWSQLTHDPITSGSELFSMGNLNDKMGTRDLLALSLMQAAKTSGFTKTGINLAASPDRSIFSQTMVSSLKKRGLGDVIGLPELEAQSVGNKAVEAQSWFFKQLNNMNENNSLLSNASPISNVSLDAARKALHEIFIKGYNQKEFASLLETYVKGHALGGQVKLPSFDVGTNFVPNDMIAQIHKGERIIPASQNNDTMDGSTYNITINAGSNASADDIAKTVINKIKQLEKMSGVKSKVGQ